MSDPLPLNLVALTPKIDEPLIPPLEQVRIFTKILGHICDLEPRLPDKGFERCRCPDKNTEDLDEGIWSKGIDFLGRYEYEPNEITVTLDICRIVKLCLRNGFHREDVIKIVLIHELAHYVTHLGKSKSGAFWEDFCTAESEEKEDFGQEATHLLLRVAGYGHLVHVFDALSNLCPPKYNTWRERRKQQLKSKENLDGVLKRFQGELSKLRKEVCDKGDDQDCWNY